MTFEDKAILVTGSTRGIGEATAKAFVDLGARVAVNGRTADSVDRAIARLGATKRLVPAPGSVATPESCAAVVDKAMSGLGGLDVLVNNAGVYAIASIEASDEALWDKILDTNLKGTFYCTRAALPALRAAKGNVVNVASVAGLVGFPGTAV